MFAISVYIPEANLESVKAAMFAAGAGKIGNYDSCSWQTLGQGQFRPLENAKPHLGQQGVVEQVKEWKVEMVCDEGMIQNVIRAMKAAHPYETPAYLVWKPLEF